MKRLLLAVIVSLVVFPVVFPSIADAQATRTWVSGVGDDVNPCSRTAPCKTFPGAISKTAAGGEINVLDPGGFGGVTITKSITIDGGGFLSGVLVSGVNAIVINGAGINVVLRNLHLNGIGTGLNGIRVVEAASVLVENLRIIGFTENGIDFEPTNGGELAVINTTVTNTSGNVVANGLFASSPNGTARVSVQGSSFLNGSGAGVKAGSNAVVSVRNSTASGNHVGFWAIGGPGLALMQLMGCEASHNVSAGVFAGSGTNFGAVRMAGTLVTGNDTGLRTDGLGFVDSWGDNRVVDNTTNGSPSRGLPSF